jgi:hypothetical protein
MWTAAAAICSRCAQCVTDEVVFCVCLCLFQKLGKFEFFSLPHYFTPYSVPTTDHIGGDDVHQSSLRGDALAEYATAHPSVVAFNTDGWLKLTLAARCAERGGNER